MVTPPEAEPAREDFEFDGWYREADCINIWNFEEDTVTGDIILYAKWKVLPGVEIRTVTFNKNGGDTEAQPASRDVVYGGPVTAPSDAPTKIGCTFAGWYREAECENAWDFAADTVTADIILYAKWEINRYTVSFDADSGTPAPTQQTVDHGGKPAEPAAMTKNGFAFEGWYREADYLNVWNFEEDGVTAHITLYAKWKVLPGVEIRTVTFNKNGGDTEASPYIREVVSGDPVTAPSAAPTRTGCTFAGWYKEPACVNEWNFVADTVTADIILYAKWNINRYTVTFSADDGTPAPTQQTVDHGGKVTEPAAPARADYTFAGWYKETALTNQWNFSTDTVTASITLYAKWIVIIIEPHTVTFNNNDGSAISFTISAPHGLTITAPIAPTKTVYIFAGWYKESACENVWDFATDTVTADITLYAKWALDESIPPEELPYELRWSKWIKDDSTATLEYSVGTDKVCEITVGGFPEKHEPPNNYNRYYTIANYKYTANANTRYTYVFEAWTKPGSGPRVISFQYYWDDDDEQSIQNDLVLTETHTTYTILGESIPKDGVRNLAFQCADQLGTFYVRIISVEKTEVNAFNDVNITFNVTDKAPDILGNVKIYRSNNTAERPHSVTLTTTGSFTNPEWYWNDNLLSSTNSVTLSVDNPLYGKLIGQKFLTLEVMVNGKPYSRTISFWVEQ